MSESAPEPDYEPPSALSGGLLATKLFARPVRANLVARPRLTKLLDEGLSASLILVSAPAGFGKTTLLAEWLSRREQPACWLSLDSGDNDPARFLAYLFTAFQGVLPNVVGDLVAHLRLAGPSSGEGLLATLVNELSLVQSDHLLVLDDYHVITSAVVNNALSFLLENMPPNLHLVIASRADPPVPVARLRAQGRMVELRAGDLRCTPAEAATFLSQTMRLSVSTDQVAALDARVEGWIAGLQMAALSMRARDDIDGFIREVTGTNRFILDFLVEEVVTREAPELQEFLLQTAFLTQLSGPLCDAVTGRSDSQQMLETLERRNLFVVPLDEDRCWYRYHHLFADLLQTRLHQGGRAQVTHLSARAAEWCEREGRLVDAINYSLAARDYTGAARLVAQYWPAVAGNGEVETVWSWLHALSEEVVRQSAPLSLACCWMLWLDGQVAAIAPRLADVERALEQPAAADTSGAATELQVVLQVQVATLRSIVARHADDFTTARIHAEHALAQMPTTHSPQADAQLRSLAYLALASACDGSGDLERAVLAYAEMIRCSRLARSATGLAVTYRMAGALRLLGRLTAAETACREALRWSSEQGMARLPATGILHLALAEVLLERNEMEAAEDALARGSALGRQCGRLDAARNSAPALVRLHIARGDARSALDAIEEAEVALGEAPSALAKAELLALKARVLVRQPSLREAALNAEKALHLSSTDGGQTGALVALAAVRLRVARAAPGEAVALLTRSLAQAEGQGRWGAVIELRILRSLALQRQGALREARDHLQRALAHAEPEGFVRIFLEEGEPLAYLLKSLAGDEIDPAEGQGVAQRYAANLLAAFAATRSIDMAPDERAGRGENGEQSGALIEPLSAREREVLVLMAAGLTNEQIATRLIIALGTVKAHVHNISGKLGAQNRAHAVARARELGLL